jgi:sulfite exporter TauE/SafE
MESSTARPADGIPGIRDPRVPENRLWLTLGAVALGVVVAGFWNYHLVDGFGRNVVAGSTLGDTGTLAGSWGDRGGGFGYIFAAVAGLAATFTACNCVVFAMMPGLACSAETADSEVSALGALGLFTAAVMTVGGAYGIFVGLLGPEGIEAVNSRPVRMAQAQAVFSILGIAMLVWGAIEMGYLDRIRRRISPVTRAFFSSTGTKATLLGLMVGLFAVGRPFPVFRDFLTYAANAESPLYGATVMAVQGLGQIAVMVGLFLLLVWAAGDRIRQMATESPSRVRAVSGSALLAGGSYFLFYWGLSFMLDIGRWGFKLGWY